MKEDETKIAHDIRQQLCLSLPKHQPEPARAVDEECQGVNEFDSSSRFDCSKLS